MRKKNRKKYLQINCKIRFMEIIFKMQLIFEYYSSMFYDKGLSSFCEKTLHSSKKKNCAFSNRAYLKTLKTPKRSMKKKIVYMCNKKLLITGKFATLKKIKNKKNLTQLIL